MGRMKYLKDVVSREQYFHDVVTCLNFRRTTGGLVWPCGETPGAVVVLGETRSRQNVLGGRHDVHVLVEERSADVSRLVTVMEIFTEELLVKLWSTPLTDARAYLLDDANDERRKLRRPLIRYGDPQYWQGKGEGLMPYYHSLVQRRTLSEKSLFFGKNSSAADEIGKLQAEDMTGKPTDYPAAAALFFALAEIDVNPMADWADRGNVSSYGGPADLIGGY